MSAKGTEQSSISRAIADLEAVDAALAKLASSRSGNEASSAPGGPISETRALLRAAITKLASAQPATDAAATSKRRVKVKAIGDAAAPADAAKPAAKSGNRRKPTEPEVKAPANSLLARLGAAAATATEPPAATAPNPAPPTPEIANTTPTADGGISAEDAVDRLARLEAEIESLTRPPAVAAAAAAPDPAKAAATESRSAPRTIARPPSAPLPEAEYEDDDEVEITIVGGKSTPERRPFASERQAPRILRHGGPTASDDADVEIVRPGEARRDAHTSGNAEEGLRIDPTSPNAPAKGGAPSRWRLFRGTR